MDITFAMFSKKFEDICASNRDCIIYFTIAPIMYVLVALFICTGNFITILAVVKTRKLQTLPNMYIVSLACADFISGVYVLNLAFLHLGITYDTIGHLKPFCLFLYIMFVMSSFLSSVNIVFIALDRYIYIVHPYRYPGIVTPRRTKRLIIGSWITGTVIAVGAIHFNKYDEIGECSFVHVLNYAYQLSSQTVLFFLTFMAVGFFYTRIVVVALKQRKAIAAVQTRTNASWRHNIRMIRLLVLICGIYVICWMPSHVLICVSISTNDFPNSLSFAFLLGILNSGVNFIIYPLMDKEFRRAFGSLVRCRKENNVTPVVRFAGEDVNSNTDQRRLSTSLA